MARGNRAENVFPGAVFGRLTVAERLPREQGKHRYIYRVRCTCECGGTSTPEICALTSGQATSCGCWKRQTGGLVQHHKAKASGKGYGSIVPGAVFGRLTVIERLPNEDRRAKARCKCSCGQERVVLCDGLVQGVSRSCGCLVRETTIRRNKESGRLGGYSGIERLTYKAWRSMLARCCRPSQKSYAKYGGAGVHVCAYLRERPQHLAEVIGIRAAAPLTLDRYPIHNGNYTCGQCEECKTNGWQLNVRWATRKEQSENRGKRNIRVTAFGQTLVLSQWAEMSGIDHECLRRRLKRGWDAVRALTTPDAKGNCYREPVLAT